ncbi:MAG: hypothetical protein AW10_00967 [Candidatus Accumulibacter appositus]|uniref:Tyrosine specific protein phosphatases domain-containing protein n=1 Tax=Candidatus Accumulibacter appositus TaxID=1454003 RepID=A0A011P2D7_9PROT|nr:cyclin-dependent kinase inhibitor 3 family protein [Accumulibacter sp.]EXI81781.1 MAG: hypothetical protein AW10_00967 [Candidatus Accumulibacter appositus]HRF04156.1 cyclin-dependent kinase inhibitor 3 family protein [Accumulibacter sp.]
MNPSLDRTSDTDPIRIDAVQPAGGCALIGMSFCPGKKQRNAKAGHWQRDLAADLARIHQWGSRMIISLVEAHEFEELQVATLPDDVDRLGMKLRHLPIPDISLPGKSFNERWPELGREIMSTLQAGQRVFLHGKGGLGQTGTIAAYLLIESGMSAEEAIVQVRLARPDTIETAIQEWFVMSYQPVLSMTGER